MRHVVLCVQNLSVPRDPRVWRQARTLVKAGYRVTVVSPRDPGQVRREHLEGVDIVRFRQLRGRGVVAYLAETLSTLLGTAILCVRLRLGGRIDVLHAANPPDTFFIVGLMLRPFGTRFVFDQHDLSPELAASKWGSRPLLQWVLRKLERASFRTADMVIANNGSYLDVAIGRGRVDPSRVVVVRNGVDSMRRISPRVDAGPLVLGYVGAMGREDGIEVLLDALATVNKARPRRVRLEMMGSGDHVAQLQAYAAKLRISKSVTWAGWLSHSALQAHLEGVSVGVSSDLGDEFSRTSTMMKVADYLGNGLPCVIGDLTENRVTAGAAALYFRPGDARDLAARIIELVDNPELRLRLGRLAFIRAPALMWEVSAIRLVAAYSWLLEGGPRVPAQQLVDEEALGAIAS